MSIQKEKAAGFECPAAFVRFLEASKFLRP